MEFFEFYSLFDFGTKAICLNGPLTITKPEHCAIYIVNPLERGLNVSKNVSLEELERFKAECRNAAWLLESQEENKGTNWGLLSIFESKRKANSLNFAMSHKHRLMEVSTLFEGEEDLSEKVEYRNINVKKEVENIRNDTKSKVKQLKKQNR